MPLIKLPFRRREMRDRGHNKRWLAAKALTRLQLDQCCSVMPHAALGFVLTHSALYLGTPSNSYALRDFLRM